VVAKVSWHWKSVVELDQLWMPKCLKLGWMLTFSVSVHESGMWKRLYIEKMVALKSSARHVSCQENVLLINISTLQAIAVTWGPPLPVQWWENIMSQGKSTLILRKFSI